MQQAIAAAAAPLGGKGRVGSWFETKDDMYLSQDRHSMVATIYPAGQATFSSLPPIETVRAALQKAPPRA